MQLFLSFSTWMLHGVAPFNKALCHARRQCSYYIVWANNTTSVRFHRILPLNFNQAWISHNIIQYLGQPAKATHVIGIINQMTKHFISEWATFKLFTLSLCKHNNFISLFQIYVLFITCALTLLSQQNERTLAVWKNTSINNETCLNNR